MSNVTEELIVAYITDNLDENKKSQVLYEIENNPELMKLYKELKSIRDDQEKIVSDFIFDPSSSRATAFPFASIVPFSFST